MKFMGFASCGPVQLTHIRCDPEDAVMWRNRKTELFISTGMDKGGAFLIRLPNESRERDITTSIRLKRSKFKTHG
jgi:hypothetical protein